MNVVGRCDMPRQEKGKMQRRGGYPIYNMNNWGIVEEWNACRWGILPKSVSENLWQMTAEKESERPRHPTCWADVSSQGCPHASSRDLLELRGLASNPDRHPVRRVSV